jgi:hypothetical protein
MKELSKILDFIKREKERITHVNKKENLKEKYIEYFVNYFIVFCNLYTVLILNTRDYIEVRERDDFKILAELVQVIIDKN